jgi:hypothetical protein
MTNRFVVLVLASLVALPCAPIPCAAQALPSKTRAAELLAKADARTQLTSPYSPQFHFIATIHYVAKLFSASGTYEVLWAAPNRFREEFRLGALRESVVVSKGEVYDSRNTPAVLYLASEAATLTGVPARGPDTALREGSELGQIPAFGQVPAVDTESAPRHPVRRHVDDVFGRKLGNGTLICIKESGNSPDFQHDFDYVEEVRTVCLDSASDEIVSDQTDTTASAARFTSSVVRSGFVDFGALRVPTHITFSSPDETMDLRVEHLNPVLNFAEGVFAPPSGASSFDWCLNPGVERPKASAPPFLMLYPGVLTSTGLDASGFHAFYMRIGPDGHISELAEIHRDGTARRLESRSIDHLKLFVQTCGGKPAEYETLISNWEHVQLNFVLPYD